jgi:nicotinamide riboside kinase
MIFSFTGPQSSGKTTLLNHLKERNDNFNFVPEVTRLVKRTYNLPINEDGTDLTQLMIINAHMHNMFKHQDNNSILDRCIFDGLIYTRWLYINSKVSCFVYDYTRRIFDLLKDKYDIIFYTSPKNVLIEDDGERSIDVRFRTEIAELYEKEFINSARDNVVVLEGTVEERLSIIKSTLEKLNIDIKI